MENLSAAHAFDYIVVRVNPGLTVVKTLLWPCILALQTLTMLPLHGSSQTTTADVHAQSFYNALASQL